MQTSTLTEAETRTRITRSGEAEEMGKCWSKNTKWQLHRIKKSRELIYSVMTVINNTVVNTGNFLRQYISGVLIKTRW